MKDFCDGARLKALIYSGIENLDKNRELVDSFDSYPISNYDAGSKLVSSFKIAFEKIDGSSSRSFSATLKDFSEKISLNSKGFLSIFFGNFLYSFSCSVDGLDKIFPKDLVRSFDRAFNEINSKLLDAKEDTVFKSMEVFKDSLNTSYTEDIGLKDLFSGAFKGLNDYLKSILEKNAVEKTYIDAGSAAFFIFLEGMVFYLDLKPIESLTPEFFKLFSPKDHIYNDTFCIEYFIKDLKDEESLKKVLKEVGNDSVISILDKQIKIHTHSLDPKKIFDRTSRFGKPHDIKISDSAQVPSKENFLSKKP